MKSTYFSHINRTVHRLTICSLVLFLAPPANAGAPFECASEWDNIGTRSNPLYVEDPNSPPLPGTPELTIDGVKRFVDENGISSVEDLLNTLPPAMIKNYTLVEKTRSNNPSSLEHPRLLLFGSDARFLMAMGSDPDDPKREHIDMAQLDEETGLWIFRELDFAQSTPTLSEDDAECVECHGSPAQPFWASYPDWPGMFGGNETSTLNAEQHDALVDIKARQADSDRFHILDIRDTHRIVSPDRIYPYSSTNNTTELATAVSEGVFKRLKSNKNYADLRGALLYASQCRINNQYPEVINKINRILTERGIDVESGNYPIEKLYEYFGVDYERVYALGTMPHEPIPSGFWYDGSNRVSSFADLLILNDLQKGDDRVREILANTSDRKSGFNAGCFSNVGESLHFRIYQGWTLRNESRQLARETNFLPNFFRADQGVFDQIKGQLCGHLGGQLLNRDDGLLPPPPAPPAPKIADIQINLPATEVSVSMSEVFNLAIDASNVGEKRATNVELYIAMPTGMYVQSGSVAGGNCSHRYTFIRCKVGAMAGNSSKTFNIKLQTINPSPAVLKIRLSASNDGNGGNNNAQVKVQVGTGNPTPPPQPMSDIQLELPKTHVNAVVNQAFDFTVNVKNKGNTKAKGVVAHIPLGHGMTAQSAVVSGATGSCKVEPNHVHCNLGEIDTNALASVKIKMRAKWKGNSSLTVELSSSNDRDGTNNYGYSSFTATNEAVVPPVVEPPVVEPPVVEPPVVEPPVVEPPVVEPPVVEPPVVEPTVLFEAHFDRGNDGFVYMDDAFRNTDQPDFSRGRRLRRRGFSGSGLNILSGRGMRPTALVPNNKISGGWKRSFSLESSASVTLSFRYKLDQARNYAKNEISEALVSIDGELKSPQEGVDFLARIQGDGMRGRRQSTGWQLVTLNLGELSAGDHSLVIGSLIDKKSGTRKITTIYIDDVVMTQGTQP